MKMQNRLVRGEFIQSFITSWVIYQQAFADVKQNLLAQTKKFIPLK